VKNKTITFDNLISERILEFLDVNEINNARISVYEHQITPQTTHLEVKN
jgi:DNA-directed RNA polymerase III subunit RPC2